jgi:ATP-dependent Lon protease
VPFPAATYPILVGRQKTVRSLDHSFESFEQAVVIAVQKDAALDDPATEDFYEIGVLARLIELVEIDDGTMKVLIEVHPADRDPPLPQRQRRLSGRHR